MVKLLLGDPNFVLPLAAYIQATGRFKQYGEQSNRPNSNATQFGN